MSPEPESQQHGRCYTRIRVHDEDDFKRLYPLIVDYIREPELALCVKEFIFRSHLPRTESYVRETDLPDVLRTEDARDISQEHAISRLPELVAAREEALADDERFLEIEPFYTQRDTLFTHYTAALLLMLCPNIEILVYEESSRVVEDVLRRNNYGLLATTHLEKLRDVTLLPMTDGAGGDEGFYENLDILAMLQLFHRLPAIESVSADGVGLNNDGGYVSRFPPATSNLERIRVCHSMYGTDVIGPLIRVPKRLEEFTFTTGGRYNLDGGYPETCAKTIGKALYEHRSSLRKIDIDIDELIGGDDEQSDDASLADEEEGGESNKDEQQSKDESFAPREEEEDEEWYHRDKEISTGPLTTARLRSTREYGVTIGSMHDFEALTHLSIGIGLLLGACFRGGVDESEEAPFRLIDALPRSLQYLLIRGYERGKVARYDGQIDEFLLSRRDRLPSLGELHGIDETIPIAVSIDEPDDDEDQLWQPKISNDDGWVEALNYCTTTGRKRRFSQV